jgi:hypothetical protein
MLEPRAHDMVRGGIDEVPVIDECGVRQIEVVNLALLVHAAVAERVDKQQQRQEALLMHAGAKQLSDLARRDSTAFSA